MPSQRLDLILRSRRVATPEGVRAAAVAVRGGRIVEVRPREADPTERAGAGAGSVVDLGDRVVLPGLVDVHVHVNEPGRAEWEGFETATRAAAAGGATAIVDMPLNSVPPTTTLRGLEAKLASARGRCAVDAGFWGGVVPGNLAELAPMAEAGALGFKAFLIDSGVPEFSMVGEADLKPAMAELARLGLPLLAHAELCDAAAEPFSSAAPVALSATGIDRKGSASKRAPAKPGSSRKYKDYLASRPGAWEVAAIRLLVRLCRETGCRVHIVHLSEAEALPVLAEAKREGLPITAETCPHYLALSAEDIPDGATHFKCAPPIRGRGNRERLWSALKDGTLDFIVSDHSPCPPELKCLEAGDFSRAWGGIASAQFRLPVVWTEARRRGLGLEDLARWLAEAPARFAGLKAKGAIAPGRDADFAVFDPDAEFTLTPDRVLHRHPLTPYAGGRWRGVVEATYLRGVKIHENGAFPSGMMGNFISASPLTPVEG